MKCVAKDLEAIENGKSKLTFFQVADSSDVEKNLKVRIQPRSQKIALGTRLGLYYSYTKIIRRVVGVRGVFRTQYNIYDCASFAKIVSG